MDMPLVGLHICIIRCNKMFNVVMTLDRYLFVAYVCPNLIKIRLTLKSYIFDSNKNPVT